MTLTPTSTRVRTHTETWRQKVNIYAPTDVLDHYGRKRARAEGDWFLPADRLCTRPTRPDTLLVGFHTRSLTDSIGFVIPDLCLYPYPLKADPRGVRAFHPSGGNTLLTAESDSDHFRWPWYPLTVPTNWVPVWSYGGNEYRGMYVPWFQKVPEVTVGYSEFDGPSTEFDTVDLVAFEETIRLND